MAHCELCVRPRDRELDRSGWLICNGDLEHLRDSREPVLVEHQYLDGVVPAAFENASRQRVFGLLPESEAAVEVRITGHGDVYADASPL